MKPYFETELGRAFLADSLDLSRRIKPDRVNLILTSPPFPLLREKEYGNTQEAMYVNWFCG